MRVRTDARRAAIVQAAWEAFKQDGFERTTMSDISVRLGGSKATLYGYFKSKEELFYAALEDALADQTEQLFSKLNARGPLRVRLAAFATAYLKLRLDPEMLAIDRMLIADAERLGGEKLYAEFIDPHWKRLADVLEAAMTSGELRRADPDLACGHFRSLIEGDLLERRRHGVAPRLGGVAVKAAVEAGIDIFFRGYGAVSVTEARPGCAA